MEQNERYQDLQAQKNVVKKLKAKDTKANKLAVQAIKQQTTSLYKDPNANTFKLKEFQNVESKVKISK